MNNFKIVTKKEQEKWITIQIKIPQNTLALVVNYIEQNGTKISMGNTQYDTEDIEKIKIGNDDNE